MSDDAKPLGSKILRAIRVAVIAICALPGIVWTIVTVVLLVSGNPFPDAGRDVWEMVVILDYFMMIASPIFVVMIWLLRWRPSTLSQPGRSIATALGVWGTLGVLMFWVRFLS
jgi:hypothetical protein